MSVVCPDSDSPFFDTGCRSDSFAVLWRSNTLRVLWLEIRIATTPDSAVHHIRHSRASQTVEEYAGKFGGFARYSGFLSSRYCCRASTVWGSGLPELSFVSVSST